jgi:hypothetical protein
MTRPNDNSSLFEETNADRRILAGSALSLDLDPLLPKIDR